MATVHRWSGREVRALREAKRMSLRAFAAHLGISERMVSKWEAGGESIHPRPINQASLDTVLACSGADVQHRFTLAIEATPAAEGLPALSSPTPSEDHQIRHPIDGRLMTLIDAGIYLSGTDNEPVWLAAF